MSQLGKETKICMVAPYPPLRGGISEYSKAIAEELAKIGDVTVLAQCVGPEGERETHGRLEVVRAWHKNSLVMPLKLFRRVLECSPTIVHIQYESYGLFGTFDFVTTPILIFLTRLTRARIVMTLHSFIVSPSERTGDLDYEQASRIGKCLKYAYQVLRTTVSVALRYTDVSLIVHSEFAARKMLRVVPGNGKVNVIPIGSTLPERRLPASEAKKRLGFEHDKVVLFFGFISEAKNIAVLIEAFHDVLRSVPDARLVISGTPSEFDPRAASYHRKLKEQSRWTERIVFVDHFVNSGEMDNIFSAADVLVQTYSIIQASSATLSTALGYGVPVVVPDGGVSAADVKFNGLGLTYDRGNPSSLSQRLVSILSDNRLREGFSKSISRVALERRWEVVARKTFEAYGLGNPQ